MRNSSEVHEMLEKLKTDLNLFGNKNLENRLESAVKHLPAYIKIVKSHIGQLQSVLQLDTHNRRNIENVNLAKPARQLIELFSKLKDEDIVIIEELYNLARNWHNETEVEAQ